MLGDSGMKGKLLEQLLKMFSQMPDKEDMQDGGDDEAEEGDLPSTGNGSPAPVAGIDPHMPSSFDPHDKSKAHKVGRR